MSISAISSRIATQRTAARFFATYNSVRAESNTPRSSGSSSSSSESKEVDNSRRPLYQYSKALSRPRANARSPLYANTSVQKSHTEEKLGSSKKNVASSSQRDDQMGEASYIAALRSPIARNDDKLRQLYSQLWQANTTAIDCIKVCNNIKHHLRQFAPPYTNITPPIFVFEMLLRKLSLVGSYDVCQEVINEMRDYGFAIDISVLNHLLKAAVQNGNETLIEEALFKITSLNGGTITTPSSSKQSSSSQHPTVLSENLTRNWNPTTYQHMIKRCALAHNPEFAMLLIGSASYRQKKGGDEYSFLSDVLTHLTVVDIVYLLCHAREARLVVELGQWFHGGVAARKLTVQSWMTILRCCADQAYLPGIKIAWDYAVNQGLFTPDDGLVIGVINAAAREGDVEFVESIQNYHKARLEQANLNLQEWHLMPLFEAYCAKKDYLKAIQSVVDISRKTRANFTTQSLIPLKSQAGRSKEDLKEAYEAFMAAGRDPSSMGGVSVVVLNSLLQAANRLRESSMVFKLYRSRKLVRNEVSPPDSNLPPLPMMQLERDEIDAIKREDEAESNDAESVSESQDDKRTSGWSDGASKKMSDEYEHGLKPDVETFNELIYAAVVIQKHQIGQIFLRHLNTAKIQANARTYELAIRLELLKDDYQDAFRLLEECKKRGIVPDRWSYLYIGKRCLSENDPRWIMIAREMLEHNYFLGGQLTYAMKEGGYMTVDEEVVANFERHGTSTYGPLPNDYSSR